MGVDGSPHGPRCFVLWNPPLTQPKAKAGSLGNLSHTDGRMMARISKCALCLLWPAAKTCKLACCKLGRAAVEQLAADMP